MAEELGVVENPKVARARNRIVNVKAQINQYELRLKDPNLDKIKREIISKTKLPELMEDLEVQHAELVLGKAEARRQIGVSIEVPVNDLTAKSEAPAGN